MYDQAQSSRLGQPLPLENPGIQLVTTATLPGNAYNGQVVYLLDIDEFRVYDTIDGSWRSPTAASAGGTQTFVSATAPVADNIGDLWLNTTNHQLYVWRAGSPNFWDRVADSQAALDAALALSKIGAKATIWYLNVQPASPAQDVQDGDYWLNTVNNRLYRFITAGSDPVEILDTDLVAAALAAERAESLVDQRIQTYSSTWAARPQDLGVNNIGDLLFVTDQGNKIYRWNGAEWVALARTTIDDTTITGTLTVSGGSTAHIQNNATLVLDGDAPNPVQAPSVIHDWEASPWTTSAITGGSWGPPASVEFTGIDIDVTNQKMYVAINVYNSARTKGIGYLYRYDYSSPGSSEEGIWGYGYSETSVILDVAVNANYLFLMQYNLTTGVYTLRRVDKSTMVPDGTSRNTFSDRDPIGIDANDASTPHVHLARRSAGKLEVVVYDQSFTPLDTWDSTTQSVGYWGYGMKQTSPSVTGISGNKFILNLSATSPSKKFTSFTPDSDLAPVITGESWQPAVPTSFGGFTHDGTYFVQISGLAPSGFYLYKYTNDTWTDSAHDQRWASVAYRRNVSGTDLYLSLEGPRLQFAGMKRARLTLVGPTIPDTGNSNDPNAMSFYLGHGTSVTRTTMYLQTPAPAVGSRQQIFDSTSPPNVDSGTNPITTSTFPVATPGILKSSEVRLDGSPKVKIDGLGGQVFLDGLIAPGTIVIYAISSIGVPGWKVCDGSAISRTGNPDLFAVLGTTFGVGDGSTTFNVPNLTAPTSMKYIIKL